MRYFAYIAEQAFKTAPDGTRLFYRSGPWARPYIVPDAATERQLFIKQLSMMRLLLGAMILGQPFLFLLVPNVTKKPLWFLGDLAIALTVSWIVGRLVFRSDLSRLSRSAARLPLRAFYTNMAAKHSYTKLVLGFSGSLLFVAGGSWALEDGENVVISLLIILAFGVAAVAWLYALIMKRNVPTTNVSG